MADIPTERTERETAASSWSVLLMLSSCDDDSGSSISSACKSDSVIGLDRPL